MIFLEKLKNAGAIILNDKQDVFNFNGSKVVINGLTDQSIIKKYQKQPVKELEERVTDLIKKDTGDLNILLYHRQQYIDVLKNLNVDIIFSGHAHGGQVRLPFLKGLYVPYQGILPKYTSDIHLLNNNRCGDNKEVSLCISRGLGNSRCPIRIFNPPEINVITVKSKGAI